MLRCWLFSILLPVILGGCPSPSSRQPRPTRVERTRARQPPPPRRPGPVALTYKRFFEVGTLRVDLAHTGDHKQESYQVAGVVQEGPWAGSRTELLDRVRFGHHFFEIRDVATGKRIYSRGFGSLFSEWQSTKEAKTKTRTFSESLRFPVPKGAFRLLVYSRRPDGSMKRILDHEQGDGRKRVFKRIPGLRPIDIQVTGTPSDRLDILILGDGYTKAEAGKFERDARRFAKVMIETDPFRSVKGRINIRALHPISPVSGVSEPRKGLDLKTPLGLSFNTFNSPRYMMTEANLALRRIAAHAPYDTLYLMGNTSRYGGGGIYNLYSTFPSDNEYDEYVFIHEFGHSFGGLADEYWTSSVAYSEMYPKGVEPWEPNLSRFLGGKVKWRSLVAKGTPLPTPNDPRFRKGVVGLFEGGGYVGRGMYRPQFDCKMKSKGNVPFCRVCYLSLQRLIRLYSAGGKGSR